MYVRVAFWREFTIRTLQLETVTMCVLCMYVRVACVCVSYGIYVHVTYVCECVYKTYLNAYEHTYIHIHATFVCTCLHTHTND
jgi:hypothetical protein